LAASASNVDARGPASGVVPAVSRTGQSRISAALRRPKVFVPAAAMAAAIATAILLASRRAPALTERDTVILADFANTTGNAIFDGPLKQALAVKLEESPFLNVFPDDRVRHTLRLMGRSPDEHVTRSTAREICERQNIKAMVTGSIAELGSQYVIALDAMNCRSGDAIARTQVEASKKEAVIHTVGEAATSLRRKLGESLASIKRFDAPAEDATTSSLEAFKAFTLGESLRAAAKEPQAIPPYRRAIELDPNFAMAYARLGTVYSNIGESKLAVQQTSEAYERRDRVSERERLYIAARYHDKVEGDLPKALETYTLWQQTYPRDFSPYNNLAAIYLNDMGRPDKALEPAREAYRLNPDAPFPFGILAFAYVAVGRLDEAKAILDEAVARKRDFPSHHGILFAIAYSRHDSAAMASEMRAIEAVDPGTALDLQARVDVFRGKLRDGVETWHKAAGTMRESGFLEAAALELISLAFADVACGRPQDARIEATAALKLASTRSVVSAAALTLANAGFASQAETLLEQSVKAFPPTHTLAKVKFIPSIRAALALQRGNPAAAVDQLAGAAPYDGRDFWLMHLRASALLAADRPPQAAAEFQRIIDRAGIDLDFFKPLAHLGLGRALARSGDHAKARTAYQDFFAAWKDADTDLPILAAANHEYERLK
jgi:tetratricopeptide (TPR) repeat protein